MKTFPECSVQVSSVISLSFLKTTTASRRERRKGEKGKENDERLGREKWLGVGKEKEDTGDKNTGVNIKKEKKKKIEGRVAGNTRN